MKCFNHPENEAVGICKCCQRGLCPTCATDLGHGLACKGKHEKEVNTINSIINQNAKIYEITPKTRNATPLFYGFMGIVFAGFGIFNGDGITGFSFIMGVGFIVFGIYNYIINKKSYVLNS